MNLSTMSRQGQLVGKIILILVVTTILIFCSSPTDSSYNPPSDHTISKSGHKHKSGLDSPLENCTSCHGADLRGGDSGVSCYECHGKKW